MLVVLLVTLAAVVFCGGCGRTRTVLVPHGQPVQLAEAVRAYIYVDVAGVRTRSARRVMLPAGWWCLADPGEGDPELEESE